MKLMLFFIMSSIFFLVSCDNNKEVKISRKAGNEEVVEMENEKQKHRLTIDSLSNEVSKISESKNVIMKQRDYAKANIFNTLKQSNLDHIIIGTKNLPNTKFFLNKILGFTIKEGRKHNNGINNLFVEFSDTTEIEFMSIQNPKDKLANTYNSFLDKSQHGFQFAIRTNSIDQLAKSFNKIIYDYSVLTKNDYYSMLSPKTFNEIFPFFFIQYNHNSNRQTNHENKTSGISAVWLSTPNIRKSIEQYSDFGFTLVDTLTLANIKSKTALMKNNNFEIILISDNDYFIAGITIKSDEVDNLREKFNLKLDLNLDVRKSKRGKSIALSPGITNSIWFEFLEN